MKYKLSWVERKHIDKLNKDVLDCDATDETGKTVKFSIWSDFPNFENINAASEIEGNLWQKPGTTSFTLYPPKSVQTNAGGASRGSQGGFKANMQKVVEQKNENIKQNMDRKEAGFQVSGTARDAVLIVTTFYPELAKDPLLSAEKEKLIREKIQMWRAWLWNEYWKEDTDFPPFNDKN